MEHTLHRHLMEVIQKYPERKIVIWGCSSVAFYIYCGLKVLRKEVSYFIDGEPQKQEKLFLEKEVKSPDSLRQERLDEIVILSAVNAPSMILEWLKANGLFSERLCFTDLHGYLTSKPYQCYDPILGYNRMDDLPGFRVFGQNAPTDFKIIVLGNSTTDFSLSRIKSWPEILSKILSNRNIPVTVYNGGLNGYSSSEELLKLLRDALALLSGDGLLENRSGERAMILSWCGAGEMNWVHNDPCFPFYASGFLRRTEKAESEFIYGVPDPRPDYKNWYKNVRCMHGLANEFGIPYYSFLQPCIFEGGYQGTDFERQWCKKVKEYSTQYMPMKKIVEGFHEIGRAHV